jgi:transcriptional regulator with XRE-family HTH domain
MMGIKQEVLAAELGEDWNQKRISLLEQKEEIEPEILQKVSNILKIPVEALQHFQEEAAVQIISNTFTDFKDNASGINYRCDLHFNPIDKVVELYERLLASEREKNELLKKKT